MLLPACHMRASLAQSFVLLQQPQRRACQEHRSVLLQVSAGRSKQGQARENETRASEVSVPRERRRRLLISLLVAANTAVWIKLSSAQHTSVVRCLHPIMLSSFRTSSHAGQARPCIPQRVLITVSLGNEAARPLTTNHAHACAAV